MALKPRCTFYDLWSKKDATRILWKISSALTERYIPQTSPVFKAVEARDFTVLLQHSIDYSGAVPVSQLLAERQVLALFSKNADIDLGIDREQAAWETFAKAELQCRSTNERFRGYERGCITSSESRLIFNVSRKISRILGEAPSIEDLNLRFGPGTNVGCRNKNTSALAKLDAEPTCSREALGGLQPLWATVPAYAYFHKGTAHCVDGKLAFVPKDAKTHRTIMVEPILNTFVQLGIGSHMKRLLKKAGCNLYSQARNRELARLGSITGDFATIDLSSASDTFASRVLLDLFPIDWVRLLSTWRTGRVTYKRKERGDLNFEMEKFSSMGNGFTFELETTLFYALALQAVQDVSATGEVSCYGDDLIVPTAAYDTLIEYLEFFGFSPNKAKSFGSGNFRESCGADWYLGTNLRPFYMKDRLTSARLVGYLNFDLRGPNLLPQDVRDELIAELPLPHRAEGPDFVDGVTAGDGHLAVQSFIGAPYKRKQGWSGSTYRTVVKQSRRIVTDYPAYTLYPSYATYSGASMSRESDPYVLRGGDRAKVQRVYTLGIGRLSPPMRPQWLLPLN